MLKSSARPAIRLRGVRQNNLKNFDLDLPLGQLIVVTGLSGSGKSSLAFDTLFAEGQRRYIETFSPYARQFFDRMDKPRVDSIEGIPPAIAIEQRNAVRTTRSTVGTMTEICDYLKTLWPHLAQLHCRQCGQVVAKEPPPRIWESLSGGEVLITFDLPLTDKLALGESLNLVAKQGYQRLLLEGRITRLEEAAGSIVSHPPGKTAGPAPRLTVVQDRLRPVPANRARFVEACEQAYHFGKGKLAIHEVGANGEAGQPPRRFSNRLHCARCDLEYREPSPALFSFNHPVGACPACKGFGRIISIDYGVVIPDRSKTLAEGLVRPWQTGLGAECQDDLMRMCRKHGVPIDVPFDEMAKPWQDFVVEGEPGYGQDAAHQWPRAWYGVKGYFRWLESKAYKMHVRVLLSRYRAYTPCPDCQGKRLQPEALLYRVSGVEFARKGGKENIRTAAEPDRVQDGGGLSLADFYQLAIRDALAFVKALGERVRFRRNDPLGLVLSEVRSRLGYLDEVGLGYLTLDRPTRSLSGGETERVNLTTCLGTRLVNTLFVLDEPSVGLHARDTERLVRILRQLRDAGNTVVVVEHEASVMRAADQIIDLGPGHGATGGHLVFQGTWREILQAPDSLTGQYLSGRKQVEIPARRSMAAKASGGLSSSRRGSRAPEAAALHETPAAYGTALAGVGQLRLTHATRNNLKDLSVAIPLGRLVCLTGVSGSGKTTLVREVLLPALETQFQTAQRRLKASDRLTEAPETEDKDEDSGLLVGPAAKLEGAECLGGVVLVDQAILGKTPRSNPAVYIGAFDDIREFFSQTEPARKRGLNASAFSFNSVQGQCERCRGAGFEKIEMQFLSDVFVRCPDCDGRRYRPHILEVKVGPEGPGLARGLSIADLLDATVEEAVEFLSAFPESRPAKRAVVSLRLLVEVGLGYLGLGQPINLLSGGESQRLKLVRHLAEVPAASAADEPGTTPPSARSRGARAADPNGKKPLMFLFDEPTTGLHFDDVRVLIRVFQRLVEAGHSVLVIEHNLDVIKSADWVIDLGPDAGDEGGQIVAEGTPEEIAACARSHTGTALRGGLLPTAVAGRRKA